MLPFFYHHMGESVMLLVTEKQLIKQFISMAQVIKNSNIYILPVPHRGIMNDLYFLILCGDTV